MAPSIGQYAPVFLPGEPPSLTEKPDRLQSTGSQWVRHNWSDPARIDARILWPVAALPQWELSMKVAQLLGLRGPWQVCRTWTASTAGVMALSESFLEPFVAGNQKASLADLSPWLCLFKALRGLPYLRCFSVVQHIRHREGPPWLGSYSVDWQGRHLKGDPEWSPTL